MLSTSLVAVLPLAGLPTCSLKVAAVPASTPELFTSRVSGSVSRLTNFSGVLKGAPGKPRQGTFTIAFAIYPVPEVGDPLWTETQQMTATPNGSHTEQPRSSAGRGLPATLWTYSIASTTARRLRPGPSTSSPPKATDWSRRRLRRRPVTTSFFFRGVVRQGRQGQG